MSRNKKARLEKGLDPTVPQQGSSEGEDKMRVIRTRVSTGPARRFCHCGRLSGLHQAPETLRR